MFVRFGCFFCFRAICVSIVCQFCFRAGIFSARSFVWGIIVDKMVYVKIWYTREQWIENFVAYGAPSNRWRTEEERESCAGKWWDATFTLRWDLDWDRVDKDAHGSYRVAFHINL